jgi:glycosyltransferase involved in cell wall biosynthesis
MFQEERSTYTRLRSLVLRAAGVVHRRLSPKQVKSIPFVPNPLLMRMSGFQENLLKRSQDEIFDLVHSVDLISAPAGDALAQRCDARHVVDVNEFPVLEHRIGREFQEMRTEHLESLYQRVKPALLQADHRIAYAAGVARVARFRFQTMVQPIRNFHDPMAIKSNQKMRDDWGLDRDAVLLVHVCTMAPAYLTDQAIHMMALLPPSFHLIFVGAATSDDYQKKLDALISQLGVGERVHFKGDIADSREYLNYVAGGDLGLIAITPDVPNVRFGLSNRFADLLAAGLPMVSTYTVETAPLIRRDGLGWVSKTSTGAALAEMVLEWDAMSKGEKIRLRKRVRTLRAKYSWDNEFNNYYLEIFKDGQPREDDLPPRAAFVFQRGLIRNRRTLRIARSLMERGWEITFYVTALPINGLEAMVPGAKFEKIRTIKDK